MKKRCIAVVLCWILIVSILLPFRVKASADPGFISQMAALMYAYGNSIGFDLSMISGTGAVAETWGQNMINTYSQSSGRSLTEIFGEQTLVATAGRLAAGQRALNGVIDVLQWIKDTYNLTNIQTLLGYDDIIRPPSTGVLGQSWAYGASASLEVVEGTTYNSYFGNVVGYGGGTGRANCGNSRDNGAFLRIDFVKNSNTLGYFVFRFEKNYGGYPVAVYIAPATSSSYGSLANDYTEPTILNPNQEWVGDVGAEPDTNLDQLIESIFDGVADTSLDVEGEVIDVPVPPGPVPTWTPVDDVIDGINQMGEQLDGLGNDIGDISGHLDDMGDQIDGIEQSLEGVQEGIQTQTGVISGAIDQATSDVVDAIGEQTAALDQTLTETAEGIQDIAEALQPGQITPRQFDLRRLFPFCIPFDIHNLLHKFDAEPVAPHVQLPFVIQSIGFSYMIDLDFSAFDPVATALRTVEFIVFAIGLAWATSKVIKW